MFNLSISNIAWEAEEDKKIYEVMIELGYLGLEIAPTRIYPHNPYAYCDEANDWKNNLHSRYGFVISSMQSIWYGRSEKIFGTETDRKSLIDYTKKAIDFANIIECRNLVFGCPRNRMIPDGMSDEIAISFFKEIGDYAWQNHTIINMEANPPIYNTNYINSTKEAIELVKCVNSEGFKLNLDIGTMIFNAETIETIRDFKTLIKHVHISEPGLKAIKARQLHSDLKRILLEGYDGFISIEMSKEEGIEAVIDSMRYVREVFQ